MRLPSGSRLAVAIMMSYDLNTVTWRKHNVPLSLFLYRNTMCTVTAHEPTDVPQRSGRDFRVGPGDRGVRGR